jgi:hypothetical protein
VAEVVVLALVQPEQVTGSRPFPFLVAFDRPLRGSRVRNGVRDRFCIHRCLVSPSFSVSAREERFVRTKYEVLLFTWAYLKECLAFGSTNAHNSITWNANQGCRSNSPAQPMCPIRIDVLAVVIRWRGVVDQTEHPEALKN